MHIGYIVACVWLGVCDRSIEWYRSMCAFCERVRTLEDIGKMFLLEVQRCLKFSENSELCEYSDNGGSFLIV